MSSHHPNTANEDADSLSSFEILNNEDAPVTTEYTTTAAEIALRIHRPETIHTTPSATAAAERDHVDKRCDSSTSSSFVLIDNTDSQHAETDAIDAVATDESKRLAAALQQLQLQQEVQRSIESVHESPADKDNLFAHIATPDDASHSSPIRLGASHCETVDAHCIAGTIPAADEQPAAAPQQSSFTAIMLELHEMHRQSPLQPDHVQLHVQPANWELPNPFLATFALPIGFPLTFAYLVKVFRGQERREMSLVGARLANRAIPDTPRTTPTPFQFAMVRLNPNKLRMILAIFNSTAEQIWAEIFTFERCFEGSREVFRRILAGILAVVGSNFIKRAKTTDEEMAHKIIEHYKHQTDVYLQREVDQQDDNELMMPIASSRRTSLLDPNPFKRDNVTDAEFDSLEKIIYAKFRRDEEYWFPGIQAVCGREYWFNEITLRRLFARALKARLPSFSDQEKRRSEEEKIRGFESAAKKEIFIFVSYTVSYVMKEALQYLRHLVNPELPNTSSRQHFWLQLCHSYLSEDNQSTDNIQIDWNIFNPEKIQNTPFSEVCSLILDSLMGPNRAVLPQALSEIIEANFPETKSELLPSTTQYNQGCPPPL